MVEALQLRVSGLNGLASAFEQVTGAENSDEAGTLLAEQSGRLIASDVIWEDFFEAPSKSVLDEQGVTGVDVPDSDFVTERRARQPDVVEARARSAHSGRPRDGAAGRPARQPASPASRRPPGRQRALQPTEENTVTASDDLAFEVLVENSGDSQETQVKVTLTIQQAPEPISSDADDPGDQPGRDEVGHVPDDLGDARVRDPRRS